MHGVLCLASNPVLERVAHPVVALVKEDCASQLASLARYEPNLAEHAASLDAD